MSASAASSTTSRPIMQLLDLIGKKWLMRVIWEMHQGACTFRELQHRCGDVSPTIINRRVKELIEAGLVMKAQPSGYCLTSKGEELVELFLPLNRWAEDWAMARDADV